MRLRKATKSAGGRVGRISKRCMARDATKISAIVAMAAPAVWQTGQACESMVREFRSMQQCNCAARKIAARNKARK